MFRSGGSELLVVVVVDDDDEFAGCRWDRLDAVFGLSTTAHWPAERAEPESWTNQAARRSRVAHLTLLKVAERVVAVFLFALAT